METTSTRALLVGPRDLDAEFAAVTATIPRSEVEAALSSERAPELYLDVQRVADATGAEAKTISVAWTREDLKRLLADARGDAITFSFAHDDLERAFEDDVEAHGFRERMLVLTVAAAAAAGAGAGSAAASVAEGTGSQAAPAIVQVSHDEALTASQLATPANDEAGLAARGIETAAVHDEASLASRGIEAPQATPAHDEALTASQVFVSPANDEASLAARGIQAGAVHDEATLASRGIDAPPAVHDEATLVDRGIQAPPVAVHDEATLAARGIEPTPVDGGSGFELPTIDAPGAAVTAGIAGFALLITAAGFAARRGRGGPRPA